MSFSWTLTALGYKLPADLTYWDCNVDGFADDACVRGYKAGAGWGGSADTRFSEAFSQWSANTDFDPVASTSGQAVYKDDRNVPCLGSWVDYPTVLGVVCISKQNGANYVYP